MKSILLFVASVFLSTQVFGVTSKDYPGNRLGSIKEVNCGVNAVCSQSAGALVVSRGNLVNLGSNTTLTGAYCGKAVVNTAAATLKLPKASTVLGCEISFIVGNASNLVVDPFDGTDQIMQLTNAAGDSVTASAVGAVATVVAISGNRWVSKGAVQGTWSDTN